MYRIIYRAKNGKTYDVFFRGLTEAYNYGDKRRVVYEIKTDDSKFTYRFVIVKEGDKRLDDETMGRLLLRITFQKMQELLDEGKEEDFEDTISRKNFPGKWPPFFTDYPKICSYRIETEEGLFCEAAAPYDTTQGATKWKICEYDCKVPEDFERCEWLIVQTLGSKAENDVRVGSRNKIGEDCEIMPDFASLKDCEDCAQRQPCVIRSDIVGESLELARKLLRLGFMKPAGNVARSVLEAHLVALCDNASLEYDLADKMATLAQKLRKAEFISDPEWRKVQFMAEIGNICSHPRKVPKGEDVAELIEAVGEFIGKPRPS